MVNLKELSKGFVKGALLIMNGLCILLALCTFGFAVVDMRVLKQYGENQATGTFVGDIIIICATLLLICIAVAGCVGVVKENLKCLYVYVGLLMIIVVLEVMISIFVALQRYGLQFRVTEWIREDFFKNVTAENQLAHEKLWDDLQTTYECCGLNGPDDYMAIQKPVSLSCCLRAFRALSTVAQQELYRVCIETASYFDQGCEDEILAVLKSDADYLLGTAVISFWAEGMGMLMATWLANNIKNSVHVYKDTVRY